MSLELLLIINQHKDLFGKMFGYHNLIYLMRDLNKQILDGIGVLQYLQ